MSRITWSAVGKAYVCGIWFFVLACLMKKGIEDNTQTQADALQASVVCIVFGLALFSIAQSRYIHQIRKASEAYKSEIRLMQAAINSNQQQLTENRWTIATQTGQIKRFHKLVPLAITARTDAQIATVRNEYEFLVSLSNGSKS